MSNYKLFLKSIHSNNFELCELLIDYINKNQIIVLINKNDL